MKGAQVAIVCNGPQLLIFQALVIGQSPLEGECYVFNGFLSYLDNFPILWRLLSPEGIAENRAYKELALHRRPRIPSKASAAIAEPTGFRYRSSLQENLRHLASILLEDIEGHPNVKAAFYQDCYVPIEANNRHLLLSKNIISARYRRVTGDGSSPIALDASNTTTKDGKVGLDEDILASVIGARRL